MTVRFSWRLVSGAGGPVTDIDMGCIVILAAGKSLPVIGGMAC